MKQNIKIRRETVIIDHRIKIDLDGEELEFTYGAVTLCAQDRNDGATIIPPWIELVWVRHIDDTFAFCHSTTEAPSSVRKSRRQTTRPVAASRQCNRR